MTTTATAFRIRITRRNGVKALLPDCAFLLRESAEQYIRKYVPACQRPEVVAPLEG